MCFNGLQKNSSINLDFHGCSWILYIYIILSWFRQQLGDLTNTLLGFAPAEIRWLNCFVVNGGSCSEHWLKAKYIHTFWSISNMYPKSFPTTWKLNWFCHQNYWSNNDKLIKQVLTTNYARDPKQCARRIFWNNGEKLLGAAREKKRYQVRFCKFPFPLRRSL